MIPAPRGPNRLSPGPPTAQVDDAVAHYMPALPCTPPNSPDDARPGAASPGREEAAASRLASCCASPSAASVHGSLGGNSAWSPAAGSAAAASVTSSGVRGGATGGTKQAASGSSRGGDRAVSSSVPRPSPLGLLSTPFSALSGHVRCRSGASASAWRGAPSSSSLAASVSAASGAASGSSEYEAPGSVFASTRGSVDSDSSAPMPSTPAARAAAQALLRQGGAEGAAGRDGLPRGLSRASSAAALEGPMARHQRGPAPSTAGVGRAAAARAQAAPPPAPLVAKGGRASEDVPAGGYEAATAATGAQPVTAQGGPSGMHCRVAALSGDKAEVSIGDHIAARPSLHNMVNASASGQHEAATFGSLVAPALSITSMGDGACSNDAAAGRSWSAGGRRGAALDSGGSSGSLARATGKQQRKHQFVVRDQPAAPRQGGRDLEGAREDGGVAAAPGQQHGAAPLQPGAVGAQQGRVLALRERRAQLAGLQPVQVVSATAAATASPRSSGSQRVTALGVHLCAPGNTPGGGQGPAASDSPNAAPRCRVQDGSDGGDGSGRRRVAGGGSCPLCNQSLVPLPSPPTVLHSPRGGRSTARLQQSPTRFARSPGRLLRPVGGESANGSHAAAITDPGWTTGGGAQQALPCGRQPQQEPGCPPGWGSPRGRAATAAAAEGCMARRRSAERALTQLGAATAPCARPLSPVAPSSAPASPRQSPSREPWATGCTPHACLLSAAAQLAGGSTCGVYSGVYRNVSLELKFTDAALPVLLSKLVKVRRARWGQPPGQGAWPWSRATWTRPRASTLPWARGGVPASSGGHAPPSRDHSVPTSTCTRSQGDMRLLKHYESGLPAWAVVLPSYGMFYR